jgi:hypothetical protein
MMVLLGYFLIAAITGIAASAIIGLVLTNLLIRRFTKAERPMNVSCASAVNEESEKSLWCSDKLHPSPRLVGERASAIRYPSVG